MSLEQVKRTFSTEEIKSLNARYRKLSVTERIEQLYKDFAANEIMLTSSFAATSAFLLRVFSKINPEQKIYFINMGYHFDETLEYKEQLTQLYGLKVEDVTAEKWEHDHDATWSVDSKTNATVKAFCCLNACARDFAKFGLLYLNYGKWNGKQLISEQRIKQTSEFDEPLNYFMYKNHFWHNPKMEIISDSTIYPKMYRKGFDYFNGEKKDIIVYPTGNYRAEGILGQFIFICPEKNMVIVRLGANYGKTDWVNLFEKISSLN